MADWQFELEAPSDERLLDAALEGFEAQLASVGAQLSIDGAARAQYQRLIHAMADELRDEARAGRISWAQAAEQANEARNAVMQTLRARSTPVGRALAQRLKREGRTLNELIARKVVQLHGPKADFAQLAPSQQNAVYAEIVKSAGKSDPTVSRWMRRLGRAGRGLLLLSLAVSIHEIAVAEDRVAAARREAAVTGAGIGGGIAGGALAGLACGPGAPLCVTVGAFAGGVLAAFGVSMLW